MPCPPGEHVWRNIEARRGVENGYFVNGLVGNDPHLLKVVHVLVLFWNARPTGNGHMGRMPHLGIVAERRRLSSRHDLEDHACIADLPACLVEDLDLQFYWFFKREIRGLVLNDVCRGLVGIDARAIDRQRGEQDRHEGEPPYFASFHLSSSNDGFSALRSGNSRDSLAAAGKQ